MEGNLIEKQILPSMLRLLMEPRTGEEPDPPQIDFSSNGRGITDMTNIDFKFPSEHTICGNKLDGEMQYYTYHPMRKRFVAVAFFLDASEGNPRNNHLQEVMHHRRVCEELQEMRRKTYRLIAIQIASYSLDITPVNSNSNQHNTFNTSSLELS